jgi:hypothetical protein
MKETCQDCGNSFDGPRYKDMSDRSYQVRVHYCQECDKADQSEQMLLGNGLEEWVEDIHEHDA